MRLKNEEGFALVFALILLATLPITAMALASYSLNAFKIATSSDQQTAAYYLARSGAEAAIAAWKDEPLADKPGGPEDDPEYIEPVIFDSNNNFILKSEFESNPSNYGEEEAEIEVGIINNDDGSTSFVSTADFGHYEETVTATVSVYTTGHADDLGWYNYNTGEIIPGPNEEEATVSASFWEWLSGLFGWGYEPETVTIKYHDEVYGTVEAETDGSDLHLMNHNYDHDNFNEDNKVAYIANTIYFRNNLDLTQQTAWQYWIIPHGRQGALITVADTLIFDGRVDVNTTTFSYGSLVLTIPEDMGYKLDDYDGIYGLVYFQDGVYYNGDEIIGPNSAYYFKRIEEDGEESGLDLIRWYEGDYEENKDDLLVEISADDPNSSPPVQEEEYVVLWN